MVRWRLFLACIVLLSGCASPPGADDGDSVPDNDESTAAPPTSVEATSPGPRQDVFEFAGSLLGAGLYTDATGGHFAGVFTISDGFIVRENATRLRFDLTWTHAIPHAMWLTYHTPEPSGKIVEATPEEMLAGALSTTVEAPVAGVWDVTARATGPAAEVSYAIVVTVDYAS